MADIILTGLNGYGGNFIKELLEDSENTLTAVVSGAPEKSPYYQQLRERGVRFFPDIEACLLEVHPDMAIICTPMHVHYREVMACLEKGIPVFCEKPLVPDMVKWQALKILAEEKGATVAVGFQWSYSEGIQTLKKDILAGTYGRIKSMKTLVNWARPVGYYAGSSWKGKMLDGDGNVIFDTPISNAASHFLHNMLFLAGADMYSSWQQVDAAKYELECRRAHDIETFDTITLKLDCGDRKLHFLGTLASDAPHPVQFEIACERGRIVFPYDEEKHIAGIHEDGTVTRYTNPDVDRMRHYRKVAKDIAAGRRVACDIDTVKPFQHVIEHIRLHGDIKPFSPEEVYAEEDKLFVKGLSAQLLKAYNQTV